MRVPPKYRFLALTAFVVAMIMSAVALAHAAPVIQPYAARPHEVRGACTDCHTYATTPAPGPVTPPVVTPGTDPQPPVAEPADEQGQSGPNDEYGRADAQKKDNDSGDQSATTPKAGNHGAQPQGHQSDGKHAASARTRRARHGGNGNNGGNGNHSD